MVWVLLGIVLGLLIGAGIVYWVLRQKIDQQSQELQRSRKAFEELEKSRESRIQTATEALQADYQSQLAQETSNLKTQHAEEIQALKQDYETRLQSTASVSVATTDSIYEETDTDSTPKPVPPAPNAPPTSVAGELPKSSPPKKPTSKPSDLSSINQPRRSVPLSGLSQSTYSSDSETRRQVAIDLKQVAIKQGVRAEAKALPILTKLIRDPDPSVRQSAVEALGSIPSEKVIPLLKQALRDPDGAVVQSAHQTFSKFKFYRTKSAKKPQKPQAKKAK